MDYPRPPRLEPVRERLLIVFDGMPIADTVNGLPVLETSHPPTYYIPPGDIAPCSLARIASGSFCEWKGRAVHYDVIGPTRRAPQAPGPTRRRPPNSGRSRPCRLLCGAHGVPAMWATSG